MDLAQLKEKLGIPDDDDSVNDFLSSALNETNYVLTKFSKESEETQDMLHYYAVMCHLSWINPEEYGKLKSWKADDVSMSFATGLSGDKDWCDRYEELVNDISDEKTEGDSGVVNIQMRGLNDRR